MKTKTILIFILVLLAALVFVQAAGGMGSEHYSLTWFTQLNSAGGGPASSPHYQVNFTVGQTAVQVSSSTNYRTRLGYWAGRIGDWLIHLPLLLRGS